MRWVFLFLLPLIAFATPERHVYCVAPTGSMKPLFDESYYLIVETRLFHDIQIGDIIIYTPRHPCVQDGVTYKTIVHQVYARSSAGGVVLCRGINNVSPDEDLIMEDQYVGTVVSFIKIEEYEAQQQKRLIEEARKKLALER